MYTGAITVSAATSDTLDAPATIPLALIVADQVYAVYLPVIAKDNW